KIQDVKEKLTAAQISELEQKIAEIHPDKLLANAQNIDPSDKLGFLKSINAEYQALGIDKPELKNEYLIASLINIRKQLSAGQVYEVNKSLTNLLEDDFVLTKTTESATTPGSQDKQVLKSAVSVDPALLNDVVNSTVGYIRAFKARADSEIEEVISHVKKISEIFDSEQTNKHTAVLLEAYGEQVNNVLVATSGNSTNWTNNLKMLASLRKTEKKYEYKIQIIDVEQTILNKITE
ncbi:hypothetical protein HY837_03770, partial [archaeon]|nr:hypothetical protein [archaeon]